jgi:hypothetical protein
MREVKSPGTRLEWGPKEIEDLREEIKCLERVIAARDETLDQVSDMIGHLRRAIQGAPCLVARPGETTYECRIDSPCRVCQWRQEVSQGLQQEWGLPNGIW